MEKTLAAPDPCGLLTQPPHIFRACAAVAPSGVRALRDLFFMQ
jgi:hypothetical protein